MMSQTINTFPEQDLALITLLKTFHHKAVSIENRKSTSVLSILYIYISSTSIRIPEPVSQPINRIAFTAQFQIEQKHTCITMYWATSLIFDFQTKRCLMTAHSTSCHYTISSTRASQLCSMLQ